MIKIPNLIWNNILSIIYHSLVCILSILTASGLSIILSNFASKSFDPYDTVCLTVLIISIMAYLTVGMRIHLVFREGRKSKLYHLSNFCGIGILGLIIWTLVLFIFFHEEYDFNKGIASSEIFYEVYVAPFIALYKKGSKWSVLYHAC